ncbi:MAG: HAD family hydrolase [Planctomycetota bacterium]
MPTRTLLLFDIDGTLLDAAGAGRAGWERATAELFGDALDFTGVTMAGQVDNAIFAAAAERAGWSDYEEEHRRLREHYPYRLAEELDRRRGRVRALPGVLPLLDALAQAARAAAGPVVGCLTGNQRTGAAMKLKAVGIDPDRFVVEAYGDEADTRPQLVQLAMQRYAQQYGHPPDPRRVVVIGDTPHDIESALAHRCYALGVATGQHDIAELTAAGADRVLPDLRDPAVLWELI